MGTTQVKSDCPRAFVVIDGTADREEVEIRIAGHGNGPTIEDVLEKIPQETESVIIVGRRCPTDMDRYLKALQRLYDGYTRIIQIGIEFEDPEHTVGEERDRGQESTEIDLSPPDADTPEVKMSRKGNRCISHEAGRKKHDLGIETCRELIDLFDMRGVLAGWKNADLEVIRRLVQQSDCRFSRLEPPLRDNLVRRYVSWLTQEGIAEEVESCVYSAPGLPSDMPRLKHRRSGGELS